MNKKSAPIIEPINVRQYEFKQSDYEMADKLPFRSIVVSAGRKRYIDTKPCAKSISWML